MFFCIIVAAVPEPTGANSGEDGYTDLDPARQTGSDYVTIDDTFL